MGGILNPGMTSIFTHWAFEFVCGAFESAERLYLSQFSDEGDERFYARRALNAIKAKVKFPEMLENENQYLTPNSNERLVWVKAILGSITEVFGDIGILLRPAYEQTKTITLENKLESKVLEVQGKLRDGLINSGANKEQALVFARGVLDYHNKMSEWLKDGPQVRTLYAKTDVAVIL